MPALVLETIGAAPRLATFPTPVAGDDERLVHVRAAGLAPFDLAYSAGRHSLGRPPTPSVVGREGVGVAEDGERVYFDNATAPFGSVAPWAPVHADRLYPVHPAVDDATAIALGAPGIAAWLALVERAQVRSTDAVIVLGATGAVGSLCLQLARLMGVQRLVAVARGGPHLERCRELGATATVALDDGLDLAATMRAAAGGAVDVVVDLLWGDPAQAALAACAIGARFVQVGNAAATEAVMAANPWRTNWVSILGYSSYHASVAQRRRAYAAVLAHAAAGRLITRTQVMAFADAPAAWEVLADGPRAKLIVAVDG
jgi:NADPH2:quinone reductase